MLFACAYAYSFLYVFPLHVSWIDDNSFFLSFLKMFQGNLVLKDFDIRKEAGGVSFRAIHRDFKAYVSQNYLEIHLFWAGKGTCCIPDLNTFGPSISAISATPGKMV